MKKLRVFSGVLLVMLAVVLCPAAVLAREKNSQRYAAGGAVRYAASDYLDEKVEQDTNIIGDDLDCVRYDENRNILYLDLKVYEYSKSNVSIVLDAAAAPNSAMFEGNMVELKQTVKGDSVYYDKQGLGDGLYTLVIDGELIHRGSSNNSATFNGWIQFDNMVRVELVVTVRYIWARDVITLGFDTDERVLEAGIRTKVGIYLDEVPPHMTLVTGYFSYNNKIVEVNSGLEIEPSAENNWKIFELDVTAGESGEVDIVLDFRHVTRTYSVERKLTVVDKAVLSEPVVGMDITERLDGLSDENNSIIKPYVTFSDAPAGKHFTDGYEFTIISSDNNIISVVETFADGEPCFALAAKMNGSAEITASVIMNDGKVYSATSTVAVENVVAQIPIMLDGNQLFSDVPTDIKNGTILLPVRVVAEELGYSPVWNRDDQTATLTGEKGTIVFTMGSKTALVNGKQVELLEAPYVAPGNRVLIPLRFFAEQLGLDVKWEDVHDVALLCTK